MLPVYILQYGVKLHGPITAVSVVVGVRPEKSQVMLAPGLPGCTPVVSQFWVVNASNATGLEVAAVSTDCPNEKLLMPHRVPIRIRFLRIDKKF